MKTRTWLSTLTLVSAGALALTACGGGGGFDDDNGGGGATEGSSGSGGGSLTLLIGSSGEAETKAVKDAAATWSKSSGVDVTVQVAADLNQQLSQGFAASSPPDLFYLSTDQVAAYANNGSLAAYFDKLDNTADFYPNLVSAFTVGGTTYCAPKDFSTLALVINTDMWKDAGLTDSDIPTTWDDLSNVAAKLTTSDHAGLSFTPEWARIGAFMAEAGGSLVNDDGTKATVDSPENLKALKYVQSLLESGNAKFAADLGAGWGGEALGIGKAAMVIEGNWIVGAMASDYPKINYKVVELPAGPAGKGTLLFTNCWGVATGGDVADATKFVEFLTSADQQMAFAKAFGVMPSIQSVRDQWAKEFPDQAAFIAGADYAESGPVNEGASVVISDFNSQLQGLPGADPAQILKSVQQNLAATLD
ncbi:MULTISPECIES: extracellular solute-binding protein [unclassified Pseudactinotalea]|uniref:sugar ABC transporter substrate-binding protein n=1 Tax=unclassified Pseudactinotalea TaxID=2649176 RepID=UPI00128CCAF5|nr:MULTISPECIES: extracellular solute-binding protein [unclassified Pseudactinotalea]MPV51147.1 extracellular solute-binding protein [Pseudactinotalea sp. HY160]QGH69049.1 extracellular solute-binding protein [Pseudactinotalea sp. HY158]